MAPRGSFLVAAVVVVALIGNVNALSNGLGRLPPMGKYYTPRRGQVCIHSCTDTVVVVEDRLEHLVHAVKLLPSTLPPLQLLIVCVSENEGC